MSKAFFDVSEVAETFKHQPGMKNKGVAVRDGNSRLQQIQNQSELGNRAQSRIAVGNAKAHRRLIRISEDEWPKRAQVAKYGVNTLAKVCGVSASTILRYVRTTFGQSPHEWMRELRMMRAKELLADGSTIKEKASELGYANQQHFSRDFKRFFGYPPGEHATRVLRKAKMENLTDLDTK